MSKITLELEDVQPCHVSKIGVTLNVNISKCAMSMVLHGLQQKGNDCHSSIARKDFEAGEAGDSKFHEAVMDAMTKNIKKIESGEWQFKGVAPTVTESAALAKLGMTAEELEMIRALRAKNEAKAEAKNKKAA